MSSQPCRQLETRSSSKGDSKIPTTERRITTSVYESLSTEDQEIRLLQILPAADATAVVEARLFATSLSKAPKYIALSYVWGDPTVTEEIIVNGRPVQVTINLAAALLDIRTTILPKNRPAKRRRSVPSFLWADALCINQKDVEERNNQVQFMGSIYQQAYLVIASIGPEDAILSLAMKMFNILATGLGEECENLEWSEDVPQLWDKDKDYEDNVVWKAIRAFLGVPFWSRIWVIQEMVFAKRLWMLSGNEVVPWKNLVTCATMHSKIIGGEIAKPQFLSRKSESWIFLVTRDFFPWSTLHLVERLKKKRAESTRLLVMDLELIFLTCYHHASEPRDMIYALLGILHLDLTPDYSASVRELYCNYAKNLANSESGFKLLMHSGAGFGYTDEFNLPSWVPDWHVVSQKSSSPFLEMTHLYESNKDMNLVHPLNKATYIDDSFKICTQGVICDYVQNLVLGFSNYRDELYSFCLGHIAGGTASIRRTQIPPLQAIFRTLLKDRHVLEGTRRLYSDPNNVGEMVITFLKCIVTSSEAKKQGLSTAVGKLGLSSGSTFLKSFMEQFSIDSIQDPELLRANAAKHVIFLDHYGNINSVLVAIVSNLRDNRLFCTERGDLALAPPGILQGDIICVLTDCTFPVLLRKQGSHFIHVGPCFILGLMDGEAAEELREGKLEMREFEIR